MTTHNNADVLARTAKAHQSEQGNAEGRGRTASDVQSEQVGMKKARHRPSGRALEVERQIVQMRPAQRRAVTRFVEPRN